MTQINKKLERKYGVINMTKICSHFECKNKDKNVDRWQLTDSRGYSCGTVCNDCINRQKSKFKPVIFEDPHKYLEEMNRCGENTDKF